MIIPPSFILWGSGAAMGLVAGFWNQAKGMMSRVAGLFLIQCSLEEGHTSTAFQLLLHNKFKRMPGGLRAYFSYNLWVKPVKEMRTVPYEDCIQTGGSLFWQGYKPLWASCRRDEKSHDDKYSFCFIRGMFNADELICEAVKLFDERKHSKTDKSRFQIRKFAGRSNKLNMNKDDSDAVPSSQASDGHYDVATLGHVRFLLWEKEQLGPNVVENAIDKLALSDQVIEVVKDIKNWFESKDWYTERGIPWKKGYLFYGTPGNGKTATVRGIGSDLGMPICVFDLSSMDNGELFKYWQEAKACSPCIVLFEDLDAVFDGRKNKVNKQGISFDALLNCIDGVDASDGLLMIVTTNHPETLDSALGTIDKNGVSSRPGRIDRAVEFSTPNRDGKIKIAKKILNGLNVDDYGIDKLVDAVENESGAQLQERMSKLALDLYWKGE